LEISLDQSRMRVGLIFGVMAIEHRAHCGAVDLPHDCGRFRQRVHHIGLRVRQRLDEPPHAEERAVSILVEALPYSQSNVVHTLAEAAAVVREINSPAVRTMFDCHNAEDETDPHSALIERNFELIRHIHVNEMDGRRPGTGNYDFRSLFRTLDRLGYQHWISLEIFDFQPDPDTVAIESLKYLKSQ